MHLVSLFIQPEDPGFNYNILFVFTHTHTITMYVATEIMDLVASKIPPLDRVELKAFNTEDEMVLALQALPRGLLPLPTCFTGGAGESR